MFQIKWVWLNLKGKRLIFVIGLVISAVTSVAAIIIPKLSQIIIDQVIVGVKNASGAVVHHTELLIPLLIDIVVVQVVVQTLRYVMVVCLEKSSQFMVLHLREKLFDNLQRMDMDFYNRNSTGDLMTRMTGDLDLIRHFCAWISYNVVDSVALFLSTLIFLFTVSAQLTLFLMLILPVLFAVTFLFSKKIHPIYVELREKLSRLNTCAQENIEGNRVVKAFSRQDYEIERFREKNGEFREMNLKAAYLWQKFFPAIELLAQALSVVILLAGGVFIMRGQLTYGGLAVFTSLSWALAYPMRNLGMLLNDFQRFFTSANKVIELYYARPRIADPEKPESAPREQAGEKRGRVSFEHVTLRYDGQTVLSDVSFEIAPGETVGIIGPTGSGKTTVANLMMRFLDPTSGVVRLDGQNIRNMSLSALRGKIAMATQDVFLFSDTVEGNIAYCDVEMPMEKVLRCAELSCSDEFVRSMPEGYDTIVGERGVGLSGGQRQRLALARALAKEPEVLILDDTTSAVDVETEQIIRKNLGGLPRSCTKVIIAQRITSVKDADRIFVVRGAKIAEAGTHAQLLALGGYYAAVDRLQKEGAEEGGVLDGAQ